MQEELNQTPVAQTPEPKEFETEVKKSKESKEAKAADDCCVPVCGPSTCG